MRITLILYATLRSHLKEHTNGRGILTLQPGATVQDVLEQLNIPLDQPMIILINGMQKAASDSLHESDTLSVFPPIAGG